MIATSGNVSANCDGTNGRTSRPLDRQGQIEKEEFINLINGHVLQLHLLQKRYAFRKKENVVHIIGAGRRATPLPIPGDPSFSPTPKRLSLYFEGFVQFTDHP